MHPSFDPRNFDYATHFRQVGFTSTLVCIELSPDGVIQRASSATQALLGYEDSELAGRHIVELFPHNEVATVRAALARSCMEHRDAAPPCTLLTRRGAPISVTPWCVGTRGSPSLLFLAAPATEIRLEDTALRRSSAAEIGEYYDAQDYSHDSNFHFGLYESATESIPVAADRLIAEFCAGIGPLTGKSVLDLGCGTGNVDVRLVTEYGCSHVHGITVSARQLSLCEQAAHTAGVGNKVRFSLMDANAMRVDDGAYDTVIAIESIFHMERDKVFAAAHRCLRAGGTLAFCDLYPVEDGIMHSASGEHTFVSLGQTVRLLRKHGFRDIRFTDWTDRTRQNYPNLFGFIIGLATHAIRAGFSAEQTFQAAANFIGRPISQSFRTELFAEVLAQNRGESKADPPFGYCFVTASRGA